jgi:hypothetical protein
VERPDDETKLQVFAEELSVAKETLEIGRVRTRHFLIRLTAQHGGRVRTETVLRSKPAAPHPQAPLEGLLPNKISIGRILWPPTSSPS